MSKRAFNIHMDDGDVKKLIEYLDRMPEGVDDLVQRVLKETVLNTRDDTISPGTFPVVTNTLRTSYNAEVKEKEGSVYSEVEYAPFVEFGTKKMKAQPYLVPAFVKHSERYVKALEKLLEREINKK